MHSDENIIFLSPEDHAKAHELLYEVYGNKQDSGAVLMLNGYESESRLAEIRCSKGPSNDGSYKKNFLGP